jgi:heme/copper-type cytochrome/quinol oxidase subunit 2
VRARSIWNLLTAALVLAVTAAPTPALACAACFGKSDSQMAHSMNWGIFTLMGVIVSVLAGVATFFVYLARRAASTPGPILETIQPELAENLT